jgi:uncharacterized membrane protein YbaN (DUF454 family)
VSPLPNTLTRRLYFLVGCIFLGLATAGIILPLLPTTPFVLLASSCFVRSSLRAQAWLLRSRWFGPSLRNWIDHRAISRPTKIVAICVASIAIVTVLLRDLPWTIRIPILILGAVGIIVVSRLPVVPVRCPETFGKQ